MAKDREGWKAGKGWGGLNVHRQRKEEEGGTEKGSIICLARGCALMTKHKNCLVNHTRTLAVGRITTVLSHTVS